MVGLRVPVKGSIREPSDSEASRLQKLDLPSPGRPWPARGLSSGRRPGFQTPPQNPFEAACHGVGFRVLGLEV